MNTVFERKPDTMHFNYQGTYLNLYRDRFHFYDPEDERGLPASGDQILELYYNYYRSNGAGGTVDGEFIHRKDITEWLHGMENVEQGKTDRFEKCFYQGNAEHYFLRLILETVDDKLRLQLSMCDALSIDYDDYINIDQLFSKEEWKAYSDEFRTWNEVFPFQLGDHVRTVKDKENGEEADKVGIVNVISVNDYLGYPVTYSVVYQEEGWDGPFWDGYDYNPDEIEIVEKDKPG